MSELELMKVILWDDMYQDDTCSHIPVTTTDILGNMDSPHLRELFPVRQWASEKHQGQSYGELPYIAHLDDVVRVGITVWPDMPMSYMRALQLHDVIEDCGVDEHDVKNQFDETTARIVKGVTNDPSLSREEKSIELNKKLSKLDAEDEIEFGIIFVKMCDRFSNVYRLLTLSGMDKLKKRYSSEYPEFRTAILREEKATTISNSPSSKTEAYSKLLNSLDAVHQALNETQR